MIFKNLEEIQNLKTTELKELTKKEFNREPKKTLFRSTLMVRGDSAKHLNKLDELRCDIAVLNLEDGISEDKKPYAKELLKLFLSHLEHSNAKIAIRVNELKNGGLKELEELKKYKPHAFRVPKIESLEEIEKVFKIAGEEIELHITIETKEAFSALTQIATHKSVKVLYFGILDLLNSLNLPQEMVEQNNQMLNYLACQFVLICKSAGKEPISFVYQNYADLDGYKKWCEWSKSIGFSGIGCIGPKQIEIANEVFSPSKEALLKAKEIKELFEAKGVKEGGFLHEKYGFIDEPIYKNALVVLRKK